MLNKGVIMKKYTFSLRMKITIFTIIIIVSSILFTSIFFTIWAIDNVKDKIRVNNMNTAINISKAPYLGDLLGASDPGEIIQDYTYKLLSTVKDIDMIVVANMESTRFAHPNVARLGKQFVGGDERQVIETGLSYISEATGTLGDSMRAFAPINNSQGKQVGFIMVGTLLDGVIASQKNAVKYIIIYSLGGLVLGIIGSVILTFNIKKSLLGLEPHQISKLYIENDSILKAIQEGIISINQNSEITMINDAASSILRIKDKLPIGKIIQDVFPGNGLEEVLKTGIPVLGMEITMNHINIVINIVPIIQKGIIVGAMATFKDKTEVTKLAEEITGFNHIVEALRANTHEFMNKLHVILGLIQLEELDQAKKYIIDTKNHQNKITSTIMKRITDPVIVGLLLGKISRAAELGVILEVKTSSTLGIYRDKNINSALVTILGNFIENSLEATSRDKKIEKKVILSIIETDNNIEIEVSDTGDGINEENINKIFNKGYSTNLVGRGIGLALVKERVESLSGNISVESVLGIGTIMKVSLPKEV